MKKLLWRIQLFALMVLFDYGPKHRWNLISTWQWTGDEDSWLAMYDLGNSPMEAIREDMSYGD